jgi:esterase
MRNRRAILSRRLIAGEHLCSHPRMMKALLHTQDLGAGAPVVVLLHGLFGLGSNLGAVARALAPERRVLVPDLRNHGRSFHAPGMDYPAMADDLRRLLDALGIDRVALLGHSMGGKLAMEFALRDPERCARLLVADIAPARYIPHHQQIFAALREVARRPDADRGQSRALLEAAGLPAEVVSLLLMHRTRAEDGRWGWRLGLEEIEAGYADILEPPTAAGPYAGPVLFLKGAQSDYIGAQHAEAIRALFPQATLKIIADAGHWLHAEKPQVFLRLARSFLLA